MVICPHAHQVKYCDTRKEGKEGGRVEGKGSLTNGKAPKRSASLLQVPFPCQQMKSIIFHKIISHFILFFKVPYRGLGQMTCVFVLLIYLGFVGVPEWFSQLGGLLLLSAQVMMEPSYRHHTQRRFCLRILSPSDPPPTLMLYRSF